MKTNILLLTLSLALLQTSNFQGQQNRSNDKHSDLKPFKIAEIQEEKSFYLIIAERNDSLFKIANFKSKDMKEHNKKIEIYKDGDYLFDLKIIHPMDSIFGMEIMNKLDVHMMVDDIIILLEEKCHYKIYEIINFDMFYE